LSLDGWSITKWGYLTPREAGPTGEEKVMVEEDNLRGSVNRTTNKFFCALRAGRYTVTKLLVAEKQQRFDFRRAYRKKNEGKYLLAYSRRRETIAVTHEVSQIFRPTS